MASREALGERHVCGQAGVRTEPCEGCTNCFALDAKEVEARRSAAEGRKTPYHFQGVDLRAELKRFCRLPVFAGGFPGARWKPGKLPPLRVRWGADPRKKHVSGHAKTYASCIVMTVNPKSTLADVLETLLHELVHVSLPGHFWHNETFLLRLARAAREAWTIEVSALDVEAKGTYLRPPRLDTAIRQALEKKFAANPESMPASAPEPKPVPPVDLVEKRKKMVEKRALHAGQMLEKNETKLKRIQKLVTKWRTAVRYYERAAAKRGT